MLNDRNPRSLEEKRVLDSALGYSQARYANVDRKSVVSGKSVDLGGRRVIKKKQSRI